MNSKTKKILAAILCCTVLLGGAGVTAFATSSGKEQEVTEEKPILAAEEDDAELVKDETVYILTGADGNVEKIIVSDWIKNSLGQATLSDQSDLKNVDNLKGNETYSMDGDNMRVWDASGNDIYYQGNIEKELPVSLSVSYTLDGKSISPSDLAGKSGRVTIRFDYQNNQFETVEIDGKQEKIYVPFTMLTGMLLDNDKFTNVSVSNGKLINDGDHTIVAGIAFPGLQGNLNVEKERLELPDYVEVSADVEGFEMLGTVTVATNEVFSSLDSEKFNSVDELTASLDELTSAMDQLMDGSLELYDGLSTLLDKSGELVNGINQLSDGAEQLSTGAGTLNDGAAALSDGAGALANGLGQLTANNAALTAGSRQIFESLLNMANTQLGEAGLSVPTLTIDNYGEVLNGVIASLDPENVAGQARAVALGKVTEAVLAQKDTVAAGVTAAVREQVALQVTAAVRENVKVQVLAAQGMTKEDYAAGIAAGLITPQQQTQVEATIDAQMQSEAVTAMIDQNTDAQMQSQEIQDTISAKTEEQIQLLIDQNMNSAQVQEQITKALEQAESGAASVSALKAQLDSYNTFYTALKEYTAGVSSAKDGADALNAGAGQLKEGTASLKTGMNQLHSGVLTLKNGAPALVDGVTKLRDGAMSLSDGLKEFNEQGIQKLVEAVDGDLGSLLTRLKATVNVSKNYKSFSGISPEMSGQVKFIYRMDSVKEK